MLVNPPPRARYVAVLACSLLIVLIVAACRDGAGPETGGPRLTIVGGGSGRDTIGVRLANPLIVEVRGPNGVPAAGVEVVFRGLPASGDSTVRPPVYLARSEQESFASRVIHDTTDGSGRASAVIVLGAPAGEGQVVASAPSLGVRATAPFTSLPGAPTAILVAPRDTPVYVGSTYRIHAHLADRLGNPVVGTASFASTSGSIQLSSTGAVQGSAIGRARTTIRIGAFVDSAFTSVVPSGTLAVLAYGHFVGDSMGFAQVGLDGGGFRWIAQTGTTPTGYAPSNEPAPQWIPGTRRIVYAQIVDGASRLFIGDSTQSSRRLISTPAAAKSEQEPDVSADGAWIYFRGSAVDGAQALWRVGVDGGAPERLTAPADGWEFRWPSVSPDGTRLAYVSASASWANFRLHVRQLATGTTTLLSPSQAASPRWSPTGEWILYTVSAPYAGYAGQLRIIRPDGTGDRALIDGAYFPGGAWSPDGKYVVATRADVGGHGLELIDVAAGTRLPLRYRASWYGTAWRR